MGKSFLDWAIVDPIEALLSHFFCDKEAEETTIIFPPAPFYPQYSPETWNDYIGQGRAKKILQSYVIGVQSRSRIFPHVLLSGNAGCGKTALARILAKQLQLNFVELIAAEIDKVSAIGMKVLETDGGILFIDEVHGLPRGLAEIFYPMMQDFKHEGTPIKPFTLIAATTELGELLKTRKPFVDRFKIPIELEPYTPEELATIAKQYAQKTFPSDTVNPDHFTIIGGNSRFTPRTAIRLTEALIYLNGKITDVLDNFGIIKDGYTHKDLIVLQYITQNEKGVGVQGLASYLGTSAENYVQQIEPYLLQTGLILRTPRGRKITETGKHHIEILKAHVNI